MPRLFTAIPMPEEIADQLDGLCHGLPAIRWADPGAFHLTLRFLGEVEQGTFVEIGAALAAVSRRLLTCGSRAWALFLPAVRRRPFGQGSSRARR